MSFLFGDNASNQTPTVYTGVQIQTSSAGVAITVGAGTMRIGANLINYQNFHKKGCQVGGKSGGGGGGATEYIYFADVQYGLCQGPIHALLHYYESNTTYAGAPAGGTLFIGTDPQSPWSQAGARGLPYAQLAHVDVASDNLGTSATVPNRNYEVTFYYHDAPNNLDCHPHTWLQYALEDGIAGLALPNWLLDPCDEYLQYAGAMGFFISIALESATTASQTFEDLIHFTNSEIAWINGKLKIIPYGSEDVSANGYTYAAPSLSCFNFTDDDYVSTNSGTLPNSEPPVKITRSRPSDAYNEVTFEYLDRAQLYAPYPITARDRSSIEAYGYRPEGSQQCHFFTNATTTATAAQLHLQRLVSYLNTYEFTVGFKNIILDVMDIGTISDSILGLSQIPVRIKSIKENDNGSLTITAEDYNAAVGGVPNIPNVTPPDPNSDDSTADAGLVNTPIIWEPPASLTNNTAQLWFAVDGLGTDEADFGGYQVWYTADLSADYVYLGTQSGGANYGSLVNPYPTGNDPDTTDTLVVDLTVSDGTLTGDTTANADLSTTLSVINAGNTDVEYISFSNATLLSTPYQYQLDTYVRRGQYGTPSIKHAAGESFIRCDDGIFKTSYPGTWVGITLYFKFLSFNSYGGGLEDIDEATEYQFQVTGSSIGGFLFDINGNQIMDIDGTPVYVRS